MGIDVFVMVLLALSIFQGWKRGLVVGIFSFVAIIIGIAAALKLSGVVAVWMQRSWPSGSAWIPFLSFLAVFVAVIMLVRIVAAFIEKTLEWSMLGWANKLGGIFFFAALYLVMGSVILYYLAKLGVVGQQAIAHSKSYPILEPIGPFVINTMGKVLPVFKDVFAQLESFFDSMVKAAG